MLGTIPQDWKHLGTSAFLLSGGTVGQCWPESKAELSIPDLKPSSHTPDLFSAFYITNKATKVKRGNVLLQSLTSKKEGEKGSSEIHSE